MSHPKPPVAAEPPDTPAPKQTGRPNRGLRGLIGSYQTPAGRQALRNLAGLVACTGIAQACAFGTLLLLAHGLSQAAFGAVIVGLNIQAYLVAVGTFGLMTVVVRDLTLYPEHMDQTATGFLAVVSVTSGLAGAVTAVVVAAVPMSSDERVMFWCVAAGNVFACLNLSPLFDAAHRQSLSAALLVPPEVFAVGAIGALSAAGTLSVPAVGLLFLGKWVLAAGLQRWGYRRAVRPIRWSADRERILQLLRSGWPILLASLLAMIPLQGGVVVIRVIQGEGAAAVYGLAVQACVLYLLITWLVARVIHPHICGPHGLDRKFIQKLVTACVVIYCGVWAASVLGGWVLTQYILPPDYRDAFGTVVLLLTVGLLTTSVRLGNAYLTRFGRERLIPWMYGAAAAVFALGVFGLSPANPLQIGVIAVASLAVPAVGSVATAFVVARSGARGQEGTST